MVQDEQEVNEDEQELFEYIRRLTTLRREFAPLSIGTLVNLYVAEQQYAYARALRDYVVVIVFNNDDKPAEIEFDVSAAYIRDGLVLHDHLGVVRDVMVRGGKIRVSLPKRSVAVLKRR